MSADAPRRIGDAQRKRRVEAKSGALAKRATRKMSAEGRERIAEATRK